MENDHRDSDRPEWGHRIGEGIAIVLLALLTAVASIIDVLHPIPKLPWVHEIAEIEPTVLAAALLVYVLFERWKLLGPAKKTVDQIAREAKRLDSIPDSERLTEMLEGTVDSIVQRLSGRSSIIMNETAEDTYRQILRVIDRVEKAKLSQVKTLRHGIFHASSATNAEAEDDQPYFVEFRDRMMSISRTDEANRWNVSVLYNVTHTDRLNVVLKDRLNLSKVGYKVRAMCFRDFYPVFSPMIIDDEHVFLAVFQEGKTRVSKSVYIRGESAAKFFASYFDALWADDRVKRLREDATVFPSGIEALTREVRDCSVSAL